MQTQCTEHKHKTASIKQANTKQSKKKNWHNWKFSQGGQGKQTSVMRCDGDPDIQSSGQNVALGVQNSFIWPTMHLNEHSRLASCSHFFVYPAGKSWLSWWLISSCSKLVTMFQKPAWLPKAGITNLFVDDLPARNQLSCFKSQLHP